MEEARDWERLFIGEIKAGRDPHRLPSRSTQASAKLDDLAAFLNAYWERARAKANSGEPAYSWAVRTVPRKTPDTPDMKAGEEKIRARQVARITPGG
jgi:hypothetical protein